MEEKIPLTIRWKRPVFSMWVAFAEQVSYHHSHRNVDRMEILQNTFIALQWCGLWRPVHWPSSKKSKIYDIYTWFIILFMLANSLSQFIGLVTGGNDVDALIKSSVFLPTLLIDCGKAVNILIKRGDLIALRNCLQQDPYRPRTEQEFAIQHEFDRMVRINTLRYTALVSITMLGVLSLSLLEDMPQKMLLYKSWMPFDYEKSLLGYLIAYNHQFFSLVLGAAIGIAFDTLVPGLMLQTCAQLNILMHRFDRMPKMLLEMAGDFHSGDESNSRIPNPETVLLSQRVKHHIEIFKFSKRSNDVFGIMIFFQFACSTSVLCFTLLRISKEKLFSSQFITLFMYMFEMGMQILFYCFYGNEVIIESLKVSDAIYEMDWSALSINARRSLLTIMARTMRPITFTTAHVATLNLESFKSLVKLSYSTYNVL